MQIWQLVRIARNLFVTPTQPCENSEMSAGPEASTHTRNNVLSGLWTAVFALAILWLAAKDWLVSSAPDYPYADSFAISAGILVAGWSAFCCRRPAAWRDWLVMMGAVSSIVYLLTGDYSFFTVRLMPSAGLLLYAFVFPLPQAAKSSGSAKPLLKYRRSLYIAAAFLGLFCFCFGPGFTNDNPQRLWIPIEIVAIASAARFTIRLASKIRWGNALLNVIFLAITSLILLSMVAGCMDANALNWLGMGLGSTSQTGLSTGTSFSDDGIISTAVKCFLIICALSVNFDNALEISQVFAGKKERRQNLYESLGLLSGATTAMLVLIVQWRGQNEFFGSGAPLGVCILAFSAASTVIAVRKPENEAAAAIISNS